ncbi:MAG: iron complex outermembrane receptor protein [Phenylobacterium sp.]|jgi:iron complex outermembrane receptor protein
MISQSGWMRNKTPSWLLMPLLMTTVAWPLASLAEQDDLSDLNLADLMNIEMVSGSKFKQDLSDITAAAYVITEQDIKNAGVTNLPELLKMVPGVFVSEATANSWAVGIRGFNSLFSNKVLVMIDGRSLFSPLFSGVFWEQIDLYIPDIERIEVIRGVGSTVWGANAVNGVVNIITKSTLDNESVQLYINKGTQLDYDVGVRVGTKIAEQSYARFYLKSKRIDGSDYAQFPVDDSWSSDAIGGKWEHFAGRDSYMFSGDYLDQSLNDSTMISSRITDLDIPVKNINTNLSFQWQRQMSTNRAFTLSSQIQQSEREAKYYRIDDHMSNIEFDTSYQLDNHQFSFGLGARQHVIDFDPGIMFEVEIGGARTNVEIQSKATILSAYIQDEWQFAPDHRLIIGSKYESHKHQQNNQNPDQYQYVSEGQNTSAWLPTLRYRLDWSDSSRFWAAVSQSVRVPSLSDHLIQVPVATIPAGTALNPSPWPFEYFSAGTRSFEKETLVSFELGFRAALNASNSIDIVAYHSRYDDVRAFQDEPQMCQNSGQAPPFCLPEDKIVQQALFNNASDVTINGVEVAWQSHLSEHLDLSLNYAYMNQLIGAVSTDTIIDFTSLGLSPQHQLGLQLDWSALDKLNLQFKYQYVGNFEKHNGTAVVSDSGIIINDFEFDPRFVDNQHTVDIALTYAILPQWTLKFNINNLLHQSGLQWQPEFPNAHTRDIERRVNLGLGVKF